MKPLAFVLLSILSLNSLPARAEYQLLEAYLDLDTKKDVSADRDHEYEEENFSIGTTFSHAPISEIVIREYDLATAKSKTTRIQVKAAFCQTGLNTCFGATSGKMALRFVGGKKLSDIVGLTYGGGALRVGVLVNLGAAYWKNGAGVLITDFESLAFSMGIKAVNTQLAIAPKSGACVEIVDEEGVAKTLTFDEAKDFQISH